MNNIEKIKSAFQFYEQELFPKIDHIRTQTWAGYHGLTTHTDSVVFRAIDYAVALNQDPIPVVFAAACHDMARTNDDYDETHGQNAIPMAQQIISQYPDKLTPQQQQSVLYAIANHTTGMSAPDYISACLWDADRTRLAWERGYRARYFHTDRAKQVAQEPAKKYLRYQNKVLGRPATTDREGVLTNFSLEMMIKKIANIHPY